MAIPRGTELEDCIYAAINTYADSRSDYFAGFKESSREIVRAFEEIAQHVLEGGAELHVSAEVEPSLMNMLRVLDAPKNKQLRNLVLECLQIDHAFASVDVAGKAERSLELVKLFLSTSPAEPALRYLRRLTRCYVAGFYPECVILCRGGVGQRN